MTEEHPTRKSRIRLKVTRPPSTVHFELQRENDCSQSRTPGGIVENLDRTPSPKVGFHARAEGEMDDDDEEVVFEFKDIVTSQVAGCENRNSQAVQRSSLFKNPDVSRNSDPAPKPRSSRRVVSDDESNIS